MIYSDGTQTRSFQCVNDLINGLVKLMNLDCKSLVNLGNPNKYSIKGFAKQIQKIIPQMKLNIVHLPKLIDDLNQWKPDITVVKTVLHCSPQWMIPDGLRKSIKYFRKALDMVSDDIIPTGTDAKKLKGK